MQILIVLDEKRHIPPPNVASCKGRIWHGYTFSILTGITFIAMCCHFIVIVLLRKKLIEKIEVVLWGRHDYLGDPTMPCTFSKSQECFVFYLGVRGHPSGFSKSSQGLGLALWSPRNLLMILVHR